MAGTIIAIKMAMVQIMKIITASRPLKGMAKITMYFIILLICIIHFEPVLPKLYSMLFLSLTNNQNTLIRKIHKNKLHPSKMCFTFSFYLLFWFWNVKKLKKAMIFNGLSHNYVFQNHNKQMKLKFIFETYSKVETLLEGEIIFP